MDREDQLCVWRTQKPAVEVEVAKWRGCEGYPNVHWDKCDGSAIMQQISELTPTSAKPRVIRAFTVESSFAVKNAKNQHISDCNMSSPGLDMLPDLRRSTRGAVTPTVMEPAVDARRGDTSGHQFGE